MHKFRLKRVRWIRAIAITLSLTTSFSAFSGIYRTNTWLLSGFGGYLPLNATDLDQVINASAVIPSLRGLIAGKLQVERGLVEPNWTHWLEVGMMGGSLVAAVPNVTYRRSLLNFYTTTGATWWFRIGSLVDFGLGGGIGIGFATQFSAAASNGQTFEGSGGVYPIFDARGLTRFWITDYIGVTAEIGLRFAQDTITDTATGASVTASMHGFSVQLGATWAITRIGGTGYSFVQVMTDEDRKKVQEEKRKREDDQQKEIDQKEKEKTDKTAARKKRLNEAQ